MSAQSYNGSGNVATNSLDVTTAAITLLAAVTSAAFVVWYHNNNDEKKRRAAADTMALAAPSSYPPGPKPNSWLLGNALQLPDTRDGTHISHRMLEWSKQYGRIFTFTVPVLGRTICIAHPTLAKYVLVTKNYPKSFTYHLYEELFGKHSMVVVNGSTWQTKRRAFTKGFTPDFLKSVVTVIHQKMIRFITNLNHGIKLSQITILLQHAQTFTADVIVQVAFGEDWNSNNDDNDADADGTTTDSSSMNQHTRDWLSELMTKVNRKAMDPLGTLLDFKLKRRVKQLEKLLDGEMMNVLERRINRMSTKSETTNKQKDILSIAIQHYQDQNKATKEARNEEAKNSDNMNDTNNAYADPLLTEDDKIAITHQLKTFYFAGHDTTAAIISWSIWLLSQHSNELDTLRNQIVQYGLWMKEKTSDGEQVVQVPTYEQIQQCEYLDAVIKETLRLYPPANSARYVENDTWTDPDTNITYQLGPATLFVDAYALHRHPDNFHHPNTFLPNRFLDGSERNLDIKYLGFMKGPRDCIGKYFAMLEAKMAISRLVMLYDFECIRPLGTPNEEEFQQQVTGIPKYGCEVKLSLRK